MGKLHLFILIFFGFIGSILLSTFFHEMSHYRDFKDISIDKEICILNYEPTLTGAIGYFRFTTANDTEYHKREKYTELKAYSISAIILSVFIYAALYQIMIKE